MHWLEEMSRHGRYGGCGRTGWRRCGFAGHHKVILNSTIRASLSPCRTFKLVPDLSFGADFAADLSLSSGEQRSLFIGLTSGADFLPIHFFQLLA